MHANEPTPAALPESGAIQSLIDELLPSQQPTNRPRNGANGATGGKAVRSVLGAQPLSAFLRGVNWANAADYRSPFVAPAPAAASGPRRVLGALPLREFLAGVNWTNTAAPPPLDIYTIEEPDHARMVLESFMNEINWD